MAQLVACLPFKVGIMSSSLIRGTINLKIIIMEKENTDLMFNAAKIIYDYPGTDKNCKAELVKMFPELEPEDEKFARIVLNLSFKHEADYKFVKAYLEKQKEQKPAEWSEEDEKMLCMIECDIRCQIAEGNTPKEEGNQRISWLKFLRPSPTREWDETDKTQLLQIIEEGVTKSLCKKGFHFHFDEEYAKDLIEYICSFNPSKSNWKPSEEQMKALEDAFRKDGGNEYRKVINSLYRDLKKLL